MNSKIAKARLNAIVKPDANNTAIEDFFATHVPLKHLQVVDQFSLAPPVGNFRDEIEIFEDYVKNPENKHQMIVVYGQSGTGKSHLIRWFKEMLVNEQLDHEVILYISRSDNTLKGTIKQLLQKEELRNIEGNEELYKKLRSASEFVDEKKLKDQIYYQFVVEVQNDHSINSVKQRKIAAFLKDDRIKDYLLRPKGPLERIYSKIDERETIVDLDVKAEFYPEDFYIDSELYQKIDQYGDLSAKRLTKKLYSDVSREKEARALSKYLNGFVEEVIQHTTNIEPGDIEQIFTNIRHQLFTQNKNLTIFIEDITSFTGVDKSLLNALLRENEGEDEKEEICRISSIIGSTTSFIQDKFLDNHKDRVSTYIYIPDNQFDQKQLFEFVGRYVNAMSLTKERLKEWVLAGAHPEDYPVHECIEGKNWDYIISDDHKLPLYPFSKNAIVNLYDTQLREGAKTPRYIIRDIIEPVAREALETPAMFPSERFIYRKQNVDVNTILDRRIGDDISKLDRLKRFIYIWGNGKADKYVQNDIQYISGIPEEEYQLFDLPVLDLKESKAVLEEEIPDVSDDFVEAHKVEEKVISEKSANIFEITLEQEKNLKEVEELLGEWLLGRILLPKGNVGAGKYINNARSDINSYLLETIDWQLYNVSMDNVRKIKDSSNGLIKFAGEDKGKPALYTIPISNNAVRLIMAFIRWNYLGKKENFNYYNGIEDAYTITNWKRTVEKDIVHAAEFIDDQEVHYIDAAISMKILNQALFNSVNIKNIQNYNFDMMYKALSMSSHVQHAKKWNEVENMLINDKLDAESIDATVKRYFNLEQGNSSRVFVIKYLEATKALKNMKKKKLLVDPYSIPNDIIKKRKEIHDQYTKYFDRLEAILDDEMNNLLPIKNDCENYLQELDIEDDEDFDDFTNDVSDFYDYANSLRFNIRFSATEISDDIKKILDAVERVNAAEKEDAVINKILLLNKPTIEYLSELQEYFQNIGRDVQIAEGELNRRTQELDSSFAEVDEIKENYQKSRTVLRNSIDILKSLRGDHCDN